MLGSGIGTDTIFNGITGTAKTTTNTNTCHFDGINDKITVADSDSLSFVDSGGNMIPMAFWCKRDATSSRDGILAKGVKGTSGTLEYRLFYHDQSNLGFFTGRYDGNSVSSSNYRDAYYSSMHSNSTNWHHVIVTFNGTGNTDSGSKLYNGFQVYKNGVLQSGVARGSDTDGMSNLSGDLKIGQTDETSTNFIFGGHLAQLTIWRDYKLTDTDISYIYNDGTVMVDPTSGAQNYSGASKVVLWMPLQDNYNDASGTGNNGTNSGSNFEPEVNSNWV